MNIKTHSKKIGRALLTTLVLGASLSTLSSGSTVDVEAAGGTGGGQGGGTGGLGVYQQIYGEPGTQKAWNTFYNRIYSRHNPSTGYSQNFIPNSVRNAGNRHGNPNLLTQCQNSRYIWYYSDWDPTYWYNMNGVGLTQAQWAQKRNASDWNDFMKWGGNNWNKGDTVLICSGSYEQLEKTETKKETRVVKNGVTIKGNYSGKTALNAVATQEYLNYTPAQVKKWQAEHPSSTSAETRTKFGTWYDKNLANIKKLDSLKGKAYTDMKNKLEKEGKAAMTETIPSPEAKMKDPAKKTFEEGGVWNVTGQKRPLNIVISGKETEERTVTIKKKLQANGTWKEVSKTYSKWTKVASSAQKDKNTENKLSSLTPINFWQMLRAKCNEPGVTKVKKDTPGYKMIDDTKVASTLHTKVYTNQKDLQLGDPKAKTEALKSTAYDKFYNDKIGCQIPIDCISDPIANSEAEKNVQDKGDKQNAGTPENPVWKFGAQGNLIEGNSSKTLSGDNFTFFRDGKSEKIRLDIWYPTYAAGFNKENTGLDLPNTKAVKTRLFFDPSGTPVDKGLSVKKDMVWNKDKKLWEKGTEILKGDNIKNKKGYMTDGELNDLFVSSTWASDKDKSHRVNADWVYEPTMTGTINTTVQGNGNSKDPANLSSKIRVYCSLQMNELTPGTNKPFIDTDMDEPIPPLTEFNDDVNRSVSFDFVRAGSGLNQR